MTSNFKEDQAEQLRKRIESLEDSNEGQNDGIIDVLSLPSRKEKFKTTKEKKVRTKRKEDKQEKKQRKRRRIRFPLIRILLFLFILLVSLVITYPIWIDRL